MALISFLVVTEMYNDNNNWEFDGIWLFAICAVFSCFTFLICGKSNSVKHEITQTHRPSIRKSTNRRESSNLSDSKRVEFNVQKNVDDAANLGTKTKPETTEDIEKEKKTRYMTLNDIEMEVSLRHADMAHADEQKAKGVPVVEEKTKEYEKLISHSKFVGVQPQDDLLIKRLVQNAMTGGQTETKTLGPLIDGKDRRTTKESLAGPVQKETTMKTSDNKDPPNKTVTKSKIQNAAPTGNFAGDEMTGGDGPERIRGESVMKRGDGKMTKDGNDAKLTKPPGRESIIKNAHMKGTMKTAVRDTHQNEVTAKAIVKNPRPNEITKKMPVVDEMKCHPGKCLPNSKVFTKQSAVNMAKKELGVAKVPRDISRRQSAPAAADLQDGMTLTETATQKGKVVFAPIDAQKRVNLITKSKLPEQKCKKLTQT